MSNELKPIMGKSRFYEEKRIEQEKRRKQRRMQERKRRERIREIKAYSILAAMVLVVVVVVCTIVSLVGGDSKSQTAEQESSEEKEQFVVSKDVLTASGKVEISLAQSDFKYECEDEIILKLQLMGKENEVIQFISENYRAYPEGLLAALVNNEELAEFALYYPIEEKKEHTHVENVSVSKDRRVPSLIQWDLGWGYYKMGESNIGLSGCGPTCMSMVMIALTGDTKYSPTYLAEFAIENKYYETGNGTMWSFFNEGATKLGLKSETLNLSEGEMKNRLDKGDVLVLSMRKGIFTNSGHYIVVYGYDENGKFLVNDPNSKVRSNQSFAYRDIESQIKNIWALSK